MSITSDQLIESIKRRISMPAKQRLMDNSDILAIADDVIAVGIVPMMIAIRQDYFVTFVDVPTVANQKEYDIPYRAIGRTLRDLKYRTGGSDNVRDMPLIALEDAHLEDIVTGTPTHFYFQGDEIVLVPPPQTDTAFIRMFYNLKRASLVEVNNAGKITNISSGTLTLNNLPSSWSTSDEFDIVRGRQGNNTTAFDLTATNVSGNQITFTEADLPSNLAVGDWVSLACTSPVVQLPSEVTRYLETMTSAEILDAVGDFEGSAKLEAAAEREKENLLKLLEPRIQGEETKIINRRGLLRGRRNRYHRHFTQNV